MISIVFIVMIGEGDINFHFLIGSRIYKIE